MGYLTLFLELLLIRYLAGNIWNMGYFPNLVLISVFIGMGVGFTFHHYASERVSTMLYQASIWVLLGLVLFVYVARPTVPGFEAWQGDLGGDLYFTATPPAAAEQTVLAFVFCIVAIVLTVALMSQRTAKLFRRFRPLTAYTLDIAGSCAGIMSFMLVSWLAIPAWAWFAVFGLVFLAPMADGWRTRWIALLPGIVLVMVAVQQDQRLVVAPDYPLVPEVYWSPYQKVEYINVQQEPHRIFVNGVSHQHMEHPDTIRGSFYWPIHKDRADRGEPPFKNVLILGAGSGSDVTAALMARAEHIDAVEIDPRIADMGKEHNPHGAYQNNKVNLVIDDGRAFMTRTRRTYDLVVFALTDSLVKVSSMSQLRLENYLFTRESVQRAYDLLNEGGELCFYNFYRQAWLKTKIDEMVRSVAGVAPRQIWRDGDFFVLSARKDSGRRGDFSPPSLRLPTDDWPFLYLQQSGIPAVYAWSMVGMCLFVAFMVVLLHLSTRSKERYGAQGLLMIKLAFVFMGAAFLLLETKSVVQFSLLFGTTWVNNSLVFLAVLLLVLAANWAALAIPGQRWLGPIFVLLLASTLLTLVVPLANLLQVESGALRFVLASLLTFSPIFFANLVFSITFRDQEVAEHIFGWNLIGATLGGIAEYASMAFGYDFLAVIVAICYVAVAALLYAAARRPRCARRK